MTQTILLIIALLTLTIIAATFYFNKRWMKFVAMIVLTIIANTIYFSLDGVKGWPAEEPSEIKGILASIVILNPSESNEGAIYIGVFLNDEKKWYEYDYPRIAPKTFYIKYSNNRAAQFEKAKKAMQEGREVRINGVPPAEGKGEGEPFDGEIGDISSIIGNMIAKLLPKQEDTYKPGGQKDIEIVEPESPPEKGTPQ